MNNAYSPFGIGARSTYGAEYLRLCFINVETVCIGTHLANLELRMGVYEFFTECPQIRIAPSITDDSMEFENYFLITPKSCKAEAHARDVYFRVEIMIG